MNAISLAALTALLCAAAAAFRLIFLLCLRRPVAARRLATIYDEGQRLQDLDFRRADRLDGDMDRIFYWRFPLVRVVYTVEGVEHRRDVRLIAWWGERPDSAPILWYDPVNPDRATAFGLASALATLVAAGGLFLLLSGAT